MRRFLLTVAFLLLGSQAAFASFTFVGTDNNGGVSDTVNIAYSGAAVSAGDLVLVYGFWQTDIGAASVSDGTSTFTAGTRSSDGSAAHNNGQWFYLPASVITGNHTYTLTATGSTNPGAIMYVFSHTGGVLIDSHSESFSLGGSTSLSSGTFTAIAGDTLVLGGGMQDTAASFTSQAIGGSSATTNQISGGFGSATGGAWYLATSGSVAATTTSSVNAPWVANAISFKLQTCTGVAGVYTATTAAELALCFGAATHNGDKVRLNLTGTIALASPLSWNAPANSEFYGNGSTSITGGNDVTNISDEYLSSQPILVINTVAGTFRMYGLTFKGGTVGGSTDGYTKYDGVVQIQGVSTQIRVDHVHLNTNTYDVHQTATGIQFNDCTGGVVDHFLWDAGAYNGNAIKMHNQFSCNSDALGQGDQSWTMAAGFGNGSPEKFIYVEDSRFNDGAANDCTYGGRFVYRFNYFQSHTGAPTLQTHPTSGQRTRGCRASESYQNQYIAEDGEFVADANWISSGTALIWGNTAPGTHTAGYQGYSNFINLQNMRTTDTPYGNPNTPDGWGHCTNTFNGTGSNWDGNATTGYPCLDQPGRGQGDLLVNNFSTVSNNANPGIHWPNQTLEPIYEWLDTWNAVPDNPGQRVSVSSGSLFAANRDYYVDNVAGCVGGGACATGVGSGTSLPTTCTTGTAYWKTNEGAWNAGSNVYYTGQGVLYKCTSTNTFTLFYTPYTYPHPLTVTAATTTKPNRGRVRR